MTPVCPKCGESEKLQLNEMIGKPFTKVHCRSCGQWWMIETKEEKKDGK